MSCSSLFARPLLVASLASLPLSVGCGGMPPPSGEINEALFANDKAAFDYFVGKGLPGFQSAGIVGNLDQESGVDPSAVQYGGGPGRGIAQWSVGGRWDTSNNDNVVWYAGTKGQSQWSLGLQLDFIWYELTTFGYGFSALKATTNVTDATVVFQDKYEICGTCDQTTRINYAMQVLNAYGGAPDWAATFVSQTWPYASQPAFDVKCGEAVAANIVLKNAGTQTWDGNTRLGTTQPRDRASIFAGSDWVGPNRAAAIQGTVAPGSDGTFAFSFHGPTGAACVPGTYMEYFGVVQEGVAWFSDSGQGGPPDNQIEALINLVPGPPQPDMTTSAPDLAGTPGSDDGSVVTHEDGGTGGHHGDGGDGGMGNNLSDGCSVGGRGRAEVVWLGALVAIAMMLARRRRRW